MSESLIQSANMSAKLRVTFDQRKADSYRAKGVPIEKDGTIVFCGSCVYIRDKKKVLVLKADDLVEIFGQRGVGVTTLDWKAEDMIRVETYFGHFILWERSWTDEDIQRHHAR